MKILALGGCGEMGGYAVRTLMAGEEPPEILVADRNAEAAESFAAGFDGSVGWMGLDISDANALDQAVAEADIVMNTVGPYFRFGKAVLSACIRAGKHYVDICDDWEPTNEMLDMHPEAKKAGITAIVGMGASPGISNMLAVKAAAELDRVEEIYTGWDLDSAKPEKIGDRPSAATIHGIHQLTGTIRAFENGDFTDEKPIRKKRLSYPGIGNGNVWTMGHPEAVTMPRYYPGLRASRNVLRTTQGNIIGFKVIAALVDLGILSAERAAWIAERIEGPADPARTTSAMLSEVAHSSRAKLPPLFALVNGIKDGAPATAACMITSAPSGGMGGATGVPMAVGADLLSRGKIAAKGVFAPEGAVIPDVFFEALAPLCSPPRKNARELCLTTRSWEPEDACLRLSRLVA